MKSDRLIKIQKILERMNFENFETVQGYLYYNQPVNLKVNYLSFKPENKILLIGDFEIPSELQIFRKSGFLDSIELHQVMGLKTKTTDLKKLLKSKIIVIKPTDLSKIGVLLARYKKKPVYLEKDMYNQITRLIHELPLKTTGKWVTFKICKVSNQQMQKLISQIHEKINHIDQQIRKSNLELELGKIGLRSTMGKIHYEE